MQKDVIYIDVDDDITAIIGKVKEAKHHIVALVPPKRIGAIQSAVNLKLVHRAAEQVDKRLVIISNNSALMALAGSAGIPVAKNLQSKPELAEVPALEIDDGEDVIDGMDAAGSDDADQHDAKDSAKDAAAEEAVPKKSALTASAAALGATAVAAKEKVKIPDFDSFRKKLFAGLAALVLLVGFVVWALLFAPRATVIITARTTDSALNSGVTLGATLATDLKAGTIKAETKSSKKDVSLAFTATGKKDVGEKSKGVVKLTKLTQSDITVQAGTEIVHNASGLVYVTDQTVVVPESQPCFPTYCAQSVSVGITAIESGTKYNGATGSASVDGLNATITSTTTGGTDKTVTVVKQSDVDAVAGNVLKTGEADAAKAELKKQFGGDYIILENTFKSDTSGVKPTPAVDAEASDAKGTLTGSVAFTIIAVKKSEAARYLDAYFAQQIDGNGDQRVYGNGLSAVSFTNISAKEANFSANISTNGKIGPKIDENALKEYAKGKRIGEIQEHIEAIRGVDSVDVKFSPFWVNSAPNDTKKITIEFKVNGA